MIATESALRGERTRRFDVGLIAAGPIDVLARPSRAASRTLLTRRIHTINSGMLQTRE
jgi:hypothetical protein